MDCYYGIEIERRRSKVHSALLFKGVVDTVSDLPKTADLGDTWLVKTTDNTYVYSGFDWVCMSVSDTQSSSDTQFSSDNDPVAQICTQCNGILKLDTLGRLHCPYCGTIYR